MIENGFVSQRLLTSLQVSSSFVNDWHWQPRESSPATHKQFHASKTLGWIQPLGYIVRNMSLLGQQKPCRQHGVMPATQHPMQWWTSSGAGSKWFESACQIGENARIYQSVGLISHFNTENNHPAGLFWWALLSHFQNCWAPNQADILRHGCILAIPTADMSTILYMSVYTH